MSRPDFELINAYRTTGEAKWLDELVARHVARVRKLIYPMVCNDSTADDLTQETFVRALRSLHQFQFRSEFGTWLGRIAINTCRDHLKKPRLVLIQKEGGLDEAASAEPEPADSVASRELVGEIEAAILELPLKLRSAVTLVCINKVEPVEAAAMEQCSLATIYWRIHQSRKLLSKRLAKHL